MKIIAFEIRVDGKDRVVKTAKELRDAIKEINKALEDTEIGSSEYQELNSQLGKLKQVQKTLRQDTRDAGKEFVISADQGKDSYRALDAQLQLLKSTYKELSREAREGIEGERIAGEVQSISTELKRLDKLLGDSFRNVGNYEESIQKALAGTEGLLSGSLAALGTGLGLDRPRCVPTGNPALSSG